jgi:hypothetical protein
MNKIEQVKKAAMLLNVSPENLIKSVRKFIEEV